MAVIVVMENIDVDTSSLPTKSTHPQGRISNSSDFILFTHRIISQKCTIHRIYSSNC